MVLVKIRGNFPINNKIKGKPSEFADIRFFREVFVLFLSEVKCFIVPYFYE